MEYIGLFVEFLLLSLGVYMLLFAYGKISTKDPEVKKKADAFREKNASWMKFLAAALVIIMLLNIFVHIQQLPS